MRLGNATKEKQPEDGRRTLGEGPPAHLEGTNVVSPCSKLSATRQQELPSNGIVTSPQINYIQRVSQRSPS